MSRQCCPECFGDRGLRKNIIPSRSSTRGVCGYCGTTNVILVDPEQLFDVFGMLVSIYQPDADGKILVDCMKEDWKLFSHEQMNAANASDLLGNILNDEDIVRHTFSPSPTYRSEGLVRWETLRDELMYRNRYFLDKTLDTERLGELLDHLPADDMPELWYRARIMTDDTPYTIGDMGAPNKNLATHGRANPTGIPYLYLGSLPDTAVAELRPHTGEMACIADFTIPVPLNLVDLRNPRKLVSPFVLEDASSIGQLRADIPFLERLGEELTRPVLPRSAAIDYLPSQYLCEFIKKRGKDGVVYRSSVSNGINIALFDPLKATGGGVSLYKIRHVHVDVTPV